MAEEPLELAEREKRRLATRCLQLRAALGSIRDLAETASTSTENFKSKRLEIQREALEAIKTACDDQASMIWADADPTPELIDASTLNADLARCVLAIAANGGMPDSFWATDSRIALAFQTMGMTHHEAYEWAHDNSDWSPGG